MAEFGANYPCFKKNGATGNGVVLGKLVQANITWRTATGSFYADDGLDEELTEVTGADIAVEVNNLSDDNDALIFGSTKGTGTSGGDSAVHVNKDDTAPLGTFGYFKKVLINGATKYRSYIFTKVRASRTNDNAQTKGQNITFSGVPLNLVCMPDDTTGDVCKKQTHDTLAACKAAINTACSISTTGGGG